MAAYTACVRRLCAGLLPCVRLCACHASYWYLTCWITGSKIGDMKIALSGWNLTRQKLKTNRHKNNETRQYLVYIHSTFNCYPSDTMGLQNLLRARRTVVSLETIRRKTQRFAEMRDGFRRLLHFHQCKTLEWQRLHAPRVQRQRLHATNTAQLFILQ